MKVIAVHTKDVYMHGLFVLVFHGARTLDRSHGAKDTFKSVNHVENNSHMKQADINVNC